MSAETPEAGDANAAHDAESASQKAASKKAKQETLQFESTTRGRFDKSEPTIVEGEDLDVPTFLRERKPN
jgi:cell division protein FtsZ